MGNPREIPGNSRCVFRLVTYVFGVWITPEIPGNSRGGWEARFRSLMEPGLVFRELLDFKVSVSVHLVERDEPDLIEGLEG